MENTIYTVKKGEALSGIAKAHETTVHAIQQLNRDTIKDSNSIMPGQQIRIPVVMSENSKADSINEAFGSHPQADKRGCPTNQLIALFPVRYAIDELSPEQGAPAKHPIPDSWGATGLPEISARNYCMRQLRDGWIYVWDGRTFDEYELKGINFTHTNRQDKTIPPQYFMLADPQVFPGEKGTKKYLEYHSSQSLLIAYAQERWSEAFYEAMQKNDNEQRTLSMRALNLAQLGSEIQPHTQLISEIVTYVADVYANTVDASDTFQSTTVHYQESADVELDPEVKPAILSAQIAGAVPEQESAFFVALDDHLGMLRDMNMQLTGHNVALQGFDETHQHKFHIASILAQFCGTSLTEKDYPDAMKGNEEACQVFKKRLEECMREVDKNINIIKTQGFLLNSSLSQSEALATAWKNQVPGYVLAVGQGDASPKTKQFRQDYPKLTFDWFSQKYRTWAKHSKSRDAVKYSEAIDFLDEEKKRPVLQQKIELIAQDIIAYLTYVGDSPAMVSLDPGEKTQCALLTTAFTSIHIQLSISSAVAKKWLAEDLVSKQTLLALIVYNFNKDLALAMEQMAKTYTETGSLEPEEPPFDVSSLVSNMISTGSAVNGIDGAIDATARALEERAELEKKLQNIINRERIQNTNTFQNLPAAAQNAFVTFAEGLKSSEHAWEGWQRSVLYRTETITRTAHYVHQTVSINIMHLVIYGWVTEEVNHLVINPDYLARIKDWTARQNELNTLIAKRELLVDLPKTLGKQAYNERIRREQGYAKSGRQPPSQTAQRRRHARYQLYNNFKNDVGLYAQRLRHEATKPVMFKIVLIPVKRWEKVMDLYWIQKVFTRIDIIETVTFKYMRPVGYAYSKNTPPMAPTGGNQRPTQKSLPPPAANDVSMLEQLKGSVGVVGAVLVALNVVNCINTYTAIAHSDSSRILDDTGNLITAHASLASLLYSFETNRLWGVVSPEIFRKLNQETKQWEVKKLISLSQDMWEKQWQGTPKALDEFTKNANKFLKLARYMAVFGIIASGVETLQIFFGKMDKAVTEEEKTALVVKGFSTGLMTIGFGYQLYAILFRYSRLAFAFGPWFAWGMAIASLIYLAASYFAEYFHYKGFDLWCARCIWTRNTPYWHDDEQGRKEEMAALQQILLTPQLFYIPAPHMTYTLPEMKKPYSYDALLNLYIQMPPLPASSQAEVKVEVPYTPSATTRNTVLASGVDKADMIKQLDDNQLWLLPETFAADIAFIQQQNDRTVSYDEFTGHVEHNRQSTFSSEPIKTDEMVWFSQVWLERFRTSFALQLEVKYPKELLAPRQDDKGYLFEIKAPLKQIAGYVEAKENAMESTKQGTKAGSTTLVVERSQHKFFIASPNKPEVGVIEGDNRQSTAQLSE